MIKQLMILAMLLLGGGCNLAGKTEELKPGERVPGAYSGLSRQVVAVVVWADWATRTEYNMIELDLGRLIQQRLHARTQPAKEKGSPELVEVRFLDHRSVFRFQREHPEYDGRPIVELAPELGASRVIYVEVEHFQTQSPRAIGLLQGKGAATLRIVEVAGGKAKIAYEEMTISAEFPPHAPEGVVPTDRINARMIYDGTLLTLAEKIMARMEEKK